MFPVSSSEIDRQQMELLPVRTVLSLFGSASSTGGDWSSDHDQPADDTDTRGASSAGSDEHGYAGLLHTHVVSGHDNNSAGSVGADATGGNANGGGNGGAGGKDIHPGR